MSEARAPRRIAAIADAAGQGVAICVVAAAAVACLVTVAVVDAGRAFAFAQASAAAVWEVGSAAALVAAGIVALVRRRPFALIVVALGGAWAAREWANPLAPGGLVFTLGLLLGIAWLPLAVWLALAYARAVPDRPGDRLAVWFAAAAALGTGAVRVATSDPAHNGCRRCPPNLLLIADLPGVASASVVAAVVLAVASGLFALIRLISHLVAASPAERGQIVPVACTCAAAIGFSTLVLGFALLAGGPVLSASRALTVPVSAALLAVAVAVSWELVRVRAARRRAARLVSELSTASHPGRLREQLAAITRDPSLGLVFPLEDRVVDTAGRTVADPRSLRDDRMRRTAVVVGRDVNEIAVLTHRPGLLDDDDFRDAVARAAGLAIEHERLQAELASRVSDLKQSRTRLVESFDTERRRLERDLHDGAQQQVVALLLELRLAAGRHPEHELDEAIREVGSAIEELRALAHGIFPAALAEDGLAAALEQLREGADVPIRLRTVPQLRWPAAAEATAYIVASETLRLGALRSADVEVSATDAVLEITISGESEGGVRMQSPSGAVGGLADRVGAVGGDLRIEDHDGRLVVRAELPCAL